MSTLSAKLSWRHLIAIVALKTEQARQFYARQAAQDDWSVRELNRQIERKAFARTGMASAQSAAIVSARACTGHHSVTPAQRTSGRAFPHTARRTALA